MENKKQDVNSLEELVKIADSYKALLADTKAPKQEDTWEMECPYEHGDTHYCIQSSGDVFADCWEDIEADYKYFSQGNIFQTEEAAKLEAKRRNLLTRFRAFRDECNDGWEPNFSNNKEKYYLFYSTEEDCIKVVWTVLGCSFNNFGYFKNKEDAERAIELFGDEIKELFVE